MPEGRDVCKCIRKRRAASASRAIRLRPPAPPALAENKGSQSSANRNRILPKWKKNCRRSPHFFLCVFVGSCQPQKVEAAAAILVTACGWGKIVEIEGPFLCVLACVCVCVGSFGKTNWPLRDPIVPNSSCVQR